MTGEVIKSFLVGLGFAVDESSLAKFNKSIATATVKVGALYTATAAAAAGIVYGISEISEGFEKMGYEYRIIAPAINKALILRRELLKAYAAAGLNITKVVQASVRLNLSLQKTKFAFKALYDSVGSRFFALLTRDSDVFREKLYAHLPQIQNVIEHLVNFVFKAIETVTQLGIRLWEVLSGVFNFFIRTFTELDKLTNGWSTIILSVVTAVTLLGAAIAASPVGVLIALGAAILALYDDYKTFEEGGKSFFNWSSFIPVIQSVERVFQDLYGILSNVFTVVFALGDAFWKLLHLDFNGFWTAVKIGAQSVWDILKGIGNTLIDLIGTAGSLGGWAGRLFGFLGSANVGANLQNTPNGVPSSGPLRGGFQSSQTNQNVQQQTSINVMGSADANAVGKAVAGEQNRVNFDMTRNMKGATR